MLLFLLPALSRAPAANKHRIQSKAWPIEARSAGPPAAFRLPTGLETRRDLPPTPPAPGLGDVAMPVAERSPVELQKQRGSLSFHYTTPEQHSDANSFASISTNTDATKSKDLRDRKKSNRFELHMNGPTRKRSSVALGNWSYTQKLPAAFRLVWRSIRNPGNHLPVLLYQGTG